MSRATAHVRVLMDNVPAYSAGMVKIAERNVAKAALDIEAHAKATVRTLGLIDTGYLLGSIQAHQRGPLRWVIEVGATYGIYHEMGTRHLPARPFLFPAAEAVRPSFYAAMRAL